MVTKPCAALPSLDSFHWGSTSVIRRESPWLMALSVIMRIQRLNTLWIESVNFFICFRSVFSIRKTWSTKEREVFSVSTNFLNKKTLAFYCTWSVLLSMITCQVLQVFIAIVLMLTKCFKKNFCRYLGSRGQEEDIIKIEFRMLDLGWITADIFSKSVKEIGNCSNITLEKQQGSKFCI